MAEILISTPFPFLKTLLNEEQSIPVSPNVEEDLSFRLFGVIHKSEQIEEAHGISACVQYLREYLGMTDEGSRIREDYSSLECAVKFVLAGKLSRYTGNVDEELSIYRDILEHEETKKLHSARLLAMVRQALLNIWVNKSKLSDEEYSKLRFEFCEHIVTMLYDASTRMGHSENVSGRKSPETSKVLYDILKSLDLSFTELITLYLSAPQMLFEGINGFMTFHALITFWYISLWGREKGGMSYWDINADRFEQFIFYLLYGVETSTKYAPKPMVDVLIALIYEEYNVFKVLSHQAKEVRDQERNMLYKDVEYRQFVQEIAAQVDADNDKYTLVHKVMEARRHSFFWRFKDFYAKIKKTAHLSIASNARESKLRTTQMKETLKMLRGFINILKKERIVSRGDSSVQRYLENCLDIAIITLGYLDEDVRNFVEYVLDEYELLDIWNADREYLMTVEEELDRLSRVGPSEQELHKGHEMSLSDCPACLSKKYHDITERICSGREVGLLQVMKEFNTQRTA